MHAVVECLNRQPPMLGAQSKTCESAKLACGSDKRDSIFSDPPEVV